MSEEHAMWKRMQTGDWEGCPCGGMPVKDCKYPCCDCASTCQCYPPCEGHHFVPRLYGGYRFQL